VNSDERNEEDDDLEIRETEGGASQPRGTFGLRFCDIFVVIPSRKIVCSSSSLYNKHDITVRAAHPDEKMLPLLKKIHGKLFSTGEFQCHTEP
jgi:hypothetical protein